MLVGVHGDLRGTAAPKRNLAARSLSVDSSLAHKLP